MHHSDDPARPDIDSVGDTDDVDFFQRLLGTTIIELSSTPADRRARRARAPLTRDRILEDDPDASDQ